MEDEIQVLLPAAIALAKNAGAKILIYHGGHPETIACKRKADNSPVSDADLAANEVIVSGLMTLSSYPILTEESPEPPFSVRAGWGRYWLVDPLDGTRGFLEGSKEFTVNISLIDQGQPILGVVYAPLLQLCYYACRGLGSFKVAAEDKPVPIRVASQPWPNYRVVLGRHLSRTVLLRIFESEPQCSILRMNSSLKLCWVAEGKADLYPRFGETGEWDTAAGQCILEEAGGVVVNFAGERLQYNRKASLINPAFVALSDPNSSIKVREFIQEKRRTL